MHSQLPTPSLRRLPVYHQLLLQISAAGIPYVSCSMIGRDLGLDPTQIRKDIEMTGIIGKPKVGYVVADLIRQIEDFLGWTRPKQALLAGAGSLGSALLRYERFPKYGVDIVAAFDTDADRVGITIDGKPVHGTEEIPEFARRLKIHLGVITTPPAAAQRVADLMVAGGIRAIWNFAPVHIRVPEHVIIQNEDLCHSLASLSFRMARMFMDDVPATAALSQEVVAGNLNGSPTLSNKAELLEE